MRESPARPGEFGRHPAFGFTKLELAILVFIILGFLALAIPNFLEPSGRVRPSGVSRAKAEMRSMATAIESYRLDQGAFPVSALMRDSARDAERLRAAGGWNLAAAAGLTTPVAYMSIAPPDPLAPESGLPFAYQADAWGWILLSAGPDRDYDARDLSAMLQGTAAAPNPIWVELAYDPTNGTKSSGDIWRTGRIAATEASQAQSASTAAAEGESR